MSDAVAEGRHDPGRATVIRWLESLRAEGLDGRTVSSLPDPIVEWAVERVGRTAVDWAVAAAAAAARAVEAITPDVGSATAGERRFLAELISVTSVVALREGVAISTTMLRTTEISWPRGIYFASFSGLLRVTAHTNAALNDRFLRAWAAASPPGSPLDDSRVIAGALYACGTTIAEVALNRSVGDLGLPDESSAHLRLALVEELLATRSLPEGFAAELGYTVGDGPHLGAVVRFEVDSLRSQQQALRHLAETLRAGEHCSVAADAGTLWAWFRLDGATDDTALTAEHLPRGVRWAAWGLPDRGIDGFARSHLQAERVADVIAAEGVAAARSARFRDLECWLAYLADPVASSQLVVRALGALAEDDPRLDPLRDTLRSTLRTRSATATAREQFLTRNAVLYRMQKIEKLLPRGTMDRPLELSIALTIRPLIDPRLVARELRIRRSDGTRPAQAGSGAHKGPV
jgi:hypothetical protein